MDIEGIYPKELHFKLELSETELNFLLDYLNHSEAQLNLSNEYEKKCHKFVVEDFFPKMQIVSERMKEIKG